MTEPTCGDCTSFREGRCIKHHAGVPSSGHSCPAFRCRPESEPVRTRFDRITSSPDELADAIAALLEKTEAACAEEWDVKLTRRIPHTELTALLKAWALTKEKTE